MHHHPLLLRILLPLLLLADLTCEAQQITGSMPAHAAADGWVHLLVARGSGSRPVDSTRVGPADGSFAFGQRAYPTGFYTLAINDSDQVDIILDGREKDLELRFSGTPLQQHITVKRSEENKRLWEYKRVSRETQAIQAAAMAEKKDLGVNDVKRMMELDSIAARAMELKQAHLKGLIEGFPKSYLARVVRTDKALDDARDQNPLAVMKVFDFSDPTLMRSSLYDKAVITFLRNIHAVSEEQFVGASDSLIAYAGRDPECRAYMLDHLIDMYATYGPEMPLHHVIDRYVASGDGVDQVDPALREKVKEVLKVSVGSQAPDVDLPTPAGPVALRSIVEQNTHTALFFYSSTCDHCHQEMPLLKETYAMFHPKGLEIIGVAMDPDSLDFQRTISEQGLPWASYSEFKGWGCSQAKAFQVRATPSLYLLDRQMRIVAKPVNAVDMHRWLEEHMK